MTLPLAMTWTARLLAVAAAVAALELWCVRRAFADQGVFAWPLLRRDLAQAPRPLRAAADLVFGHRGTLVLVALQLGGAVALPFTAQALPAWLVFAAALLLSIRFRGSYNGGSDSMLLVVALALALARTAPDSALALVGLAYLAAQLVLSYFIAGIAKLGDANWRQGRALPLILGLPHYRAPGWARKMLAQRLVAPAAAWLVVAFECTFPLVLLHRRLCLAFVILAAGFHLGNAVVLGLNRFWWTWLAAYPALLFWVERAHLW